MPFKPETPPPRAPTLEEIVKIFGIAKNFEFSHNFSDDSLRVSFTVSKEDCVEAGLHVNIFASVLLSELKEHLARLAFFEELVKRYADPMSGGSTAADCIAFLRNELKNIGHKGTLEDKMRERFFKTIIDKLTELGQWRTFVDAERFEARRKQHEQEEELRRQAEDAFRNAAFKEAEENAYNYYRKWREDPRNDFKSAFDDLNEAFRERAKEGNFRGWQYYEQPYQRKHHQGGQGGNAGVRSTGKWYEILGVPINSSKATIKSAWRKLAKLHHPDRKGGDAKKMAEINAAKDEGLSGASS